MCRAEGRTGSDTVIPSAARDLVRRASARGPAGSLLTLGMTLLIALLPTPLQAQDTKEMERSRKRLEEIRRERDRLQQQQERLQRTSEQGRAGSPDGRKDRFEGPGGQRVEEPVENEGEDTDGELRYGIAQQQVC